MNKKDACPRLEGRRFFYRRAINILEKIVFYVDI